MFFPLLYTLQASISKPMALTNSQRHAFDGRTYRRISNQIPIRDPNGIYNSGSQWIPYYNKEKPKSKLTKVLWGVEASSAKERLTM